MNVINESLKGTHSFEGVGLVQVNGVDHGCVGVRTFDFGLGGKVKYFDNQIKRIAAQRERFGTIAVIPAAASTSYGDVAFMAGDGKPILYYQYKEGLEGGGEIDTLIPGGIIVHPEFVLIGILATGEKEIVSGALSTAATHSAYEPNRGPFFYLRVRDTP